MKSPRFDSAESPAHRILLEELADVTAAMLDAGSAAALAVSVERLPDGKTRARPTSEAAYLTAIWRAMLTAKLSEPPPIVLATLPTTPELARHTAPYPEDRK